MSSTRALLQVLFDGDLDASVYPIVAPQNASLPFVIVACIWEAQDFALAGAADAFDARFSLACNARSAADADGLAEAIKRVLEGIRRREITTGAPAASLGVLTCWKEGTDTMDYSDDRTVFRRIMDWRVRWERPE